MTCLQYAVIVENDILLSDANRNVVILARLAACLDDGIAVRSGGCAEFFFFFFSLLPAADWRSLPVLGNDRCSDLVRSTGRRDCSGPKKMARRVKVAPWP